MALPALLKKLFANEGAGNKLKKEIIPDLSPEYITNYENGTITSSSAEKGIGFGQKGDGEFAVIMNGDPEEFGISLYQDYGGGTLYDKEMLKWRIDNGNGSFTLNAINPMADDIKYYRATSLRGTIEGKLTWNEKPVITLVDSWKDGENWYRKYSDGWIEQGGLAFLGSWTRLNLHVPMRSNQYLVIVVAADTHEDGYANIANYKGRTTTYFNVDCFAPGKGYVTDYVTWEVRGYY